MSSSISILESPHANMFTLTASPAAIHSQEPGVNIPRAAAHDLAHTYMAVCDYVPSSLTLFSSEILLLIVEHLRDIDHSSLWRLRRVCHHFYALATPSIYHRVVFNKNLLHEDAEVRYAHAFTNLSRYTKHVVIRSNLSPPGIRRVLRRIPKLSSIEWHFEDEELQTDGVWLPADLLDAGQTQSTRLSIENLPLHEFHPNAVDSYAKAIPTNLLVSLKLAYPTPPLTTRLGSLKHLLLAATRLEVLYYQDRGQGTQFRFNPGERFPPFRELTLKSYDWHHGAEEVEQHWDFSRLRSLELISMPTFNFLDSVCFSDLEDLHTLHVEDWSAHLLDRRMEATQKLYSLVKNHVRELESLEITCHVAHFPVDAIIKHQSSLRRLKLRDHAGFSEDDRTCPVLNLSDLARLADNLTNIHTLEIDMNSQTQHAEAFIQILSRFPKLDTLTLHTQTTLQHLETISAGADPDYRAAIHWFSLLLRYRSHHVNPGCCSWKKITLNVGGWKRVMVRRVSLRWRLLGEMGIHAERCFVLEKQTEQYGVREEMAFETRSSRVTPELEDDIDEEEDDGDDL